MKTAIVRSSYCDITIDTDTGNVISIDQFDPSDPAYETVVRFDLDEYFNHYKDESRETATEFDILDLGAWAKDGSYEEPNTQWRADIKEGRL